MTIATELSVVIGHGQRDLVEKLLLSLRATDTTPNPEIIVIHNDWRGTPDFEFSVDLPSRYLVNNRPKGYAANVNAAFSQASGRYLCTINPDVLFLQDTFAPLMEDIREGRGDIVAPAVVDHRDRLQDSARNLPTAWSLILHRIMPGRFVPANVKDPPEHPDWIAGTLLLMQTELFEDLCGMDERLFPYFEDVDFSTRARLVKHQHFLNRSVWISHKARRRSRREPHYTARHLSSAYCFFRSDVHWQAHRLKSA